MTQDTKKYTVHRKMPSLKLKHRYSSDTANVTIAAGATMATFPGVDDLQVSSSDFNTVNACAIGSPVILTGTVQDDTKWTPVTLAKDSSEVAAFARVLDQTIDELHKGTLGPSADAKELKHLRQFAKDLQRLARLVIKALPSEQHLDGTPGKKSHESHGNDHAAL